MGEQPDLSLNIHCDIKAEERHNPLFVPLIFVIHWNTNNAGNTSFKTVYQISAGSTEITCEIELTGLIPDTYFLSAWIGEHNNLTADWQKEVISFEVITSPVAGRTIPHSYANGFVIPHSRIVG